MIDLKAIRAAAEADKGQDRAFILLSVDILALLDRLEAAEKDASRYRWLREQHWNTDVIGVLVRPKTHSHLGSIFPSLKLLDDTIDHMRKEQK